MAENRLAELNRVPSFSQARKAAHVKLFNLQNERNLLVDKINQHKLLLEQREFPADAVTRSELQNASDEIFSAEGNSAFNQINQDKLDTQLTTVEGPEKEIFNRQLEESFQTVKQMQDDDLLTENEEQLFEAAQASESDTNILTNGIRKMTQCLIKAEK